MTGMYLYGCGGHARSVLGILHETEGGEEIILVDDNAKDGERILGHKVLRPEEAEPEGRCFAAVGNNQKRKEIYERLKHRPGIKFAVIRSARADVREEVSAGDGTLIAAGAYIGPQAVIGENTIINTGAVVEHEVRMGNHSHVAPHATVCGRSFIGNEVFIGAGATVIDGIHICDNVTVGAGAVVVKDIEEPGTYAGVPAQKIG